MRRIILCLLFFMLILISPAYAAESRTLPVMQEMSIFYIDKNIVSVDGHDFTIDAPPYISSGRTFLPVRFLGETLGAEVSWINEEVVMKFQKQNKTLILKPGEIFLNNNGRYELIDVAAQIVPPGRTCLPARYVCEAAGYQVSWDEVHRAMIILH